MKTLWIPSAPVKSVVEIEHSPFQSLQRLTRSELSESRAVPAAERRLGLPNFVETFDWEKVFVPACRCNYPRPVKCLAGQAECAAPPING